LSDVTVGSIIHLLLPTPSIPSIDIKNLEAPFSLGSLLQLHGYRII
jgi:hypothetical protein